jgi:hypothetical protein
MSSNVTNKMNAHYILGSLSIVAIVTDFWFLYQM